MDINSAKNITNECVRLLDDGGMFDNPFIHKHIFKARLYRCVLSLQKKPAMKKINSIVFNIYNEVEREGIDQWVRDGFINETNIF